MAREAADRLTARFPGLVMAGIESPPYRDLTAGEYSELLARIHAAKPDMLFVAFGQPKGELWIAKHCDELGVPVCVQVGASLDFVSGRVRRAPGVLRKVGMEWVFRLALEPRRLGPRYARNGFFVLGAFAKDLARLILRGGSGRGETSYSRHAG